MVKKTTRVLLCQDVEKLGKPDTVVKVSMGYARNYLLPKKIAIPVTQSILNLIQKKAVLQEQKLKNTLEIANKRKVLLESVGKFTLRKKVGKNDLIFGSVSDKEVASLITAKTGELIPKQNIQCPEIKNTGVFSILVNLHPSVTASIKLQIIPENS
uniref:ribosomal protein L9 n=1 Tax=Glaucosphaera vacuolata TaxID=38265 RepID=UPI001FCD175A|nr:ribosomal protein L9 [Glaucosphaera vacuolata]UNJ18756.1 ribosomal protein L9 [Glaucosphaera vacuolata]